MSEKTKEKQLLSSENDKKNKDIDILKAFQILKDIPLSKISFLVILYTSTFFIIPYFVYYRFLPIDSSLTSIPLKFILLGAFGIFLFLHYFLFLLLVSMDLCKTQKIYIFANLTFPRVKEKGIILRELYIWTFFHIFYLLFYLFLYYLLVL